ncbi:MAG TPA: response regulator [Pyrinomonadaceae bacterium]|jgi:two-component system CheB/CheR fusion protein
MPGLSLPCLPVSQLPPNLFSQRGSDDFVDAAAPSQESALEEKRQTRVLVVDDVPDVLEMLGMLLSLSGYEVEVAASPIEALEHARVMLFDVIVSDIGMPEMSGYELARRLRDLPGYADVPMIAVTGFSLYNDRTQALESGFNAHISKPVNPSTLLDLIERLRE